MAKLFERRPLMSSVFTDDHQKVESPQEPILPFELWAIVIRCCVMDVAETQTMTKSLIWLARTRGVSRQWKSVIHSYFIDSKKGVFDFFQLAQSIGSAFLRKSHDFHIEGAHAKAAVRGWLGNNLSQLEACGIFLSKLMKPLSKEDYLNFLKLTLGSEDPTIDGRMATYQPSKLWGRDFMTLIKTLVTTELFWKNISGLPHQNLDPFLLGVASFDVLDPTKILGHCVETDGIKHPTLFALLLEDHHRVEKLFRMTIKHKDVVNNRELAIAFFEPVFDVLRDAGMFDASKKLQELCCPEDALNTMASEMPQDSFKPKATVKTVASGKSKAAVSATQLGTPSKRSRRK
jgi:hypothetical protein